MSSCSRRYPETACRQRRNNRASPGDSPEVSRRIGMLRANAVARLEDLVRDAHILQKHGLELIIFELRDGV